MQFDKLDRKIQEAADQFNPAFNEESWNKMEALLDKHMPVTPVSPVTPATKENKRNHSVAWIFLLLFILVGSIVILLINPWKINNKSNPAPVNEKSNFESKDQANNNSNTKSITPATIQNKNIADVKSKPQILLSANTFNKEAITKKPSLVTKSLQPAYHDQSLELMNGNYVNKLTTDDLTSESTKSDFEHKIINDISIYRENLFAKSISVNKPITTSINTPLNKKPTSIRKHKFDELFSLSFSAGPDVSAVDINNVGTVKVLLGAGIGYNIGKKWQVRTGVYAVKKVYTASPSDYHPPTYFWTYYPNLDDVNADCRVIEVPLAVNYKFSQTPRQAWFASAGLSSYFMKKETYNYHSKISPGLYQDKTYTIENQNKHYLSSLRLSAGYEKNLNKTISLSVEPYVNVPLSGVGFGKVKLNSAGVLLSVSIKPFAKNK